MRDPGLFKNNVTLALRASLVQPGPFKNGVSPALFDRFVSMVLIVFENYLFILRSEQFKI